MADLLEGALPLNLVAIDVARYSNAVLIELSDGKRQRFRMTNNASDFDRLLSYQELNVLREAIEARAGGGASR
ncbi:hypothetical protein [Burkholderia orbicola]|uniref:hypothetical protein n=1 Tax=Burkholderia orbicola TaxID=2978683 RepID=UPI003A5C5C3A